ncbi:Possible FlgD protein [Oceanicola granulosus HTCC2516]|uniref:Basal-body rod modification protein FlgD n=2 Tax=Oceanicola granulosus TaxID=252302 RepID=Q2CDG3_OCEGH|nr:Possible FlgD protein [Oceanicola granulosus HTCC2516]
MLTVQLKNQDPLNPVESADYAVQLATFSQVEQQVLTNDLLTSLSEQLGAAGLGQVADWVGREARVAAAVSYVGTAIDVVVKPAEGADLAYIVLRDENGIELERQPVEAEEQILGWHPAPGNDVSGRRLSFEIESFAAGESLGTVPAEVYASVREVRMRDGTAHVVLSGGASAPASEVTALRVP